MRTNATSDAAVQSAFADGHRVMEFGSWFAWGFHFAFFLVQFPFFVLAAFAARRPVTPNIRLIYRRMFLRLQQQALQYVCCVPKCFVLQRK
jgi:hypothetical protein